MNVLEYNVHIILVKDNVFIFISLIKQLMFINAYSGEMWILISALALPQNTVGSPKISFRGNEGVSAGRHGHPRPPWPPSAAGPPLWPRGRRLADEARLVCVEGRARLSECGRAWGSDRLLDTPFGRKDQGLASL